METLSRQAPAATKATTPEEAFTLQTDGELLEYVFAPLPKAVEVTVGAVAAIR
jgi:hypothetical protein